MFNFEKLDVWNEAITFADLVYSVSRHFPEDERFGLTINAACGGLDFIESRSG
jgi:hypothetical protein